MMDRLAFSDDAVRSQQLSQWRTTWSKAGATATLANPAEVQIPGPASAIAGGLAAAATLPPAFVPLPTSVSGGAYAISATSASNAYREDSSR